MARLLFFSFGLFSPRPQTRRFSASSSVARDTDRPVAPRASPRRNGKRRREKESKEQRKLDARMEKKEFFSIAMVSASTIRTPCPSFSYPAAAAAVGAPHSSAAVEPPREEEGGSRTFSWKEKETKRRRGKERAPSVAVVVVVARGRKIKLSLRRASRPDFFFTFPFFSLSPPFF